MQQQNAWVTYAIIVLLVFIFVYFLWRMPLSLSFFIAFLVGLLFFSFVSPGVTMETNDDRTWFGILNVLVVILPFLFGFWALYSGDLWYLVGGCETASTWVCEGDVCRLVRQDQRCGRANSTFNYPQGEVVRQYPGEMRQRSSPFRAGMGSPTLSREPGSRSPPRY